MIIMSDVGSSEEVALFNAAFLSRLLHSSVRSFDPAGARGMPVALAFLLLPLVLHKPTRDDLPSNAASQMQTWIRDHPRHVSQLEGHVLGMRPFVSMAVRFGLRHGVLTSEGGSLGAGTLRRRTAALGKDETPEIVHCVQVASFLGRWFARQPDAATLLAIWGLKP